MTTLSASMIPRPRWHTRPGRAPSRTAETAPMILPAPHVEYFRPMLIVFRLRSRGVLAEVFPGRRWRYGALRRSALTGRQYTHRGHRGGQVDHGRVTPRCWGHSRDRATLFLQGNVLLVTIMAAVFMAERGRPRVSPQRQNTRCGAGLP